MTIAVSRSIGDVIFKSSEFCGNAPIALIAKPHILIRYLDTEKDFFVLLACDGVFDVYTHEEVAKMASTGLKVNNMDPEAAARDVVISALQKGSTDNCSCLIVSFESQKD